MNLAALLAEQARARADAVALIDARGRTARRFTFGELERAVAVAAGWLRDRGIARGDRVLVLVPISAELYVLLLALWRLEAAAVIVDPGAGRAHIANCCARVEPRALLAVPVALAYAWLVPALRRIPRKLAVGTMPWPFAPRWRFGVAARPVPASGREDGAAPALLTFTSGSTGEPKVAVRTHAFLVAQDAALRPALRLESGETDLITLPVFVFANLAAGATSLLPDLDLRRPGAIDGASAARQIAALGVTRCTASPAFFARLAEHARAEHAPLGSLRKLFTGGAPVFPALLDELRAAAPGAQIDVVYGSTEAEPIAHFDAAELSAVDRAAIRGGAGLPAGRPVPEVELRILADEWGRPRGRCTPDAFAAQVRPAGEIGEIVVSGRHVLPGYLDGRGDEETKFRVGDTVWHRTGDAGRIDADGRLWLLGRCGAKIEDARGRLYPFAVEAAALQPEFVRTAFVAIAGRRVLAVELRPGATCDAAALRAELAWAALDEVRCVARIPVDRRHNAKIDYPALRRELAG